MPEYIAQGLKRLRENSDLIGRNARGFYETAGSVKVFVFAFVFSLLAFLFLLLFLLLPLHFRRAVHSSRCFYPHSGGPLEGPVHYGVR